MTKDGFRIEQKKQCPTIITPNSMGVYGCPCCRYFGLNRFKKETRKLAKVRFRRNTKQEIEIQLKEAE